MAPCHRSHAEQTSLTSARHPQQHREATVFWHDFGKTGVHFCDPRMAGSLAVNFVCNRCRRWHMGPLTGVTKDAFKCSVSQSNSSKSADYHVYFPGLSGSSSSLRKLSVTVFGLAHAWPIRAVRLIPRQYFWASSSELKLHVKSCHWQPHVLWLYFLPAIVNIMGLCVCVDLDWEPVWLKTK